MKLIQTDNRLRTGFNKCEKMAISRANQLQLDKKVALNAEKEEPIDWLDEIEHNSEWGEHVALEEEEEAERAEMLERSRARSRALAQQRARRPAPREERRRRSRSRSRTARCW